MKKRGLLLVALALVLLLSACGSKTVFSLSVEGYSLDVDTANGTITHGKTVYTYVRDTHSIIETITTIRYPNGATYTHKSGYGIVTDTPGSSGSSIDSPIFSEDPGVYTGTVDENRYVPGRILVEAVKRAVHLKENQKEEKSNDGKLLFVGLFLLVAGFLNLRFPEEIWYLEHFWCVDGGYPTDFYLTSCRIGGIVCLVVGAFCILAVIF